MSTTPTTIDFIRYHQPALESGQYQVTIDQTLSQADGTVLLDNSTTPSTAATATFYVAGERFHILPEHIKSAFPPPHSLGEHSNVFPHLMLSRTTLPWERHAIPILQNDSQVIKDGKKTTPWLALLVIHESEAANATVNQVFLSDLKTASPVSPFFPGITNLEPGQTDDMKIAVLDIKKSLLDQILPNKDALELLTHIRQGKDDKGNLVGEDLAVVIANRLPKKDESATVYLVSLEGRYKADGTFNHHQNAGNNDLIRLVKLHSWEFTCSSPQGDFANVLKHLDRSTETLRLPDMNDPTADPYLKTGFYPLPHRLRGGAQTVSWYHGPLSPQSNTESLTLPAKGADALLRYYQSVSMFDVSYAAAWELGRLLALQNTKFSTGLYQWKRRYAKATAKQSQITADATVHLHDGNRDHSTEALPASLTTWLDDLKLLKGIPFNYLVPDEKLLPAESIRFFQLDQLWVKSLLDGAFSIGRVTSSAYDLDTAIADSETALTATAVSGFILRSEAVSGWPGMQVEGYKVTPTAAGNETNFLSNKINVIRQEQLSKNVLLCLFDGDLQTLDLHLKPEVLHFGVTLKNDNINYEKALRDSTGNATAHVVDVGLNSRVINLTTLLSSIQGIYNANNNAVKWHATPTSADLALQLIEGVEKVRFIKT